MTLKEYYQKIGIPTPKTLLDREVQLYESLTEDNDILLAAYSHNDNALTATQKELEDTKKFKRDYKTRVYAGYVATGVSLVFLLACFSAISAWATNNEELVKLQRENKELRDTPNGILQQKNDKLMRENVTLKDKKCIGILCLK